MPKPNANAKCQNLTQIQSDSEMDKSVDGNIQESSEIVSNAAVKQESIEIKQESHLQDTLKNFNKNCPKMKVMMCTHAIFEQNILYTSYQC